MACPSGWTTGPRAVAAPARGILGGMSTAPVPPATARRNPIGAHVPVAGRGLAGQLVQAALTDVRAAGKRIVPVCPYVAKFLVKHEEFSDIADEVTPEVKGWLRSQLG